jgi:monoterpene epsilon-lactone hydrolase
MSDPQIGALRAKILSRPPTTDLAERRKLTDERGLAYGLAGDVSVEKVTANGVAAEWTSTPGAARDAAILYAHGGGYLFGSLDSHRHLVAALGRAANCVALAFDYRLAPEHPFPAPVEDAVAAYRFLLTQGFRPERIAIAGDSAGGGLVVAAMVAIREAGLAQPGCGWCLSPWIDMEALGGSMESKAVADPMVQKAGILEIAKAYLGGADLTGIAPLLIQVGAAETLLDDAIRLAQRAGAADVRVDLQVWPEMVHVWPLFWPELDAGKRALDEAGAWIRQALRT